MSLRRAALELVATVIAGLVLGTLAMAFFRSSEAAAAWLAELIHLIRYGI